MKKSEGTEIQLISEEMFNTLLELVDKRINSSPQGSNKVAAIMSILVAMSSAGIASFASVYSLTKDQALDLFIDSLKGFSNQFNWEIE